MHRARARRRERMIGSGRIARHVIAGGKRRCGFEIRVRLHVLLVEIRGLDVDWRSTWLLAVVCGGADETDRAGGAPAGDKWKHEGGAHT